jgi:hypothetical protein
VSISSSLSLADEIEKRGYAIVPALFSSAEVQQMRREIYSLFRSKVASYTNLGKVQNNAPLEVDTISWLYIHPAVLRTFQEALRTNEIVFTGVCDLHMNRLSGWHKDTGDSLGGYFTGDYYNSPDSRVYKMAIYLQDHNANDAGLSVREASHHTPDTNFGEERYLATKAGDAIMFDVRTTHIGQKPDLFERKLIGASSRFNRRHMTKPDREFFVRVKNLYWKLAGRQDRLAVFLCYGYPNRQTEVYARSHLQWQLRQYHGRITQFPAKLRDSLQNHAVRMADVVAHPFNIDIGRP